MLDEDCYDGNEQPILEIESEEEAVADQDAADEPLEATEARKYRGIAARLNYVAADRVDIQFAVKEASRAMSAPKKSHWSLLTKIGRYLRGRPRLVMTSPWQVEQSYVTTFTDSDWAGCVRTARSTSGGIITIGDHTIKSYSRQQKVVALSSAEAELYAMVAASAETLAIIAYARDLGMSLEGEVYTDSSAALGISQRAGIGKVRHLRTQGLWVQEVRVTGRLAYRKVLGTKNPADVLTKHVPSELLDRHLETLGTELQGGRAQAAPELNSLEVESWVTWLPEEVEPEEATRSKRVTFLRKVGVRAIPSQNRGRRCQNRKETAYTTTTKGKVQGGDAKGIPEAIRRPRPSWADLTDEEDELLGRFEHSDAGASIQRVRAS